MLTGTGLKRRSTRLPPAASTARACALLLVLLTGGELFDSSITPVGAQTSGADWWDEPRFTCPAANLGSGIAPPGCSTTM